MIADDGEPDKRNTCGPWSWLEVHPFITVLRRNRWPGQALFLADWHGVSSNLDDEVRKALVEPWARRIVPGRTGEPAAGIIATALPHRFRGARDV